MIALEHVPDLDIDRNLQMLAKLTIDAGGRSVGLRFGTVTLTWTANTASGSVSVAHGLGKTPVVVLATGKDAAVFGQIPSCNPNSYTATTFTMSAETKNSWTGTMTLCWVAIG